MNEKQNKILEIAVSTYGAENQMDMMVEEVAELIQAINKFKRNGGLLNGNTKVRHPCGETNTEFSRKYYNVCSEIADVKIMLAQMEILFDNDAINLTVDRKIERLKERLTKTNKF